MQILVPIVLAAFAAGLVGGLVVRRRGRWYELPLLALAFGWVVSFFVFDVWFNAIDHATASEPESPSEAMGIGAGLSAIPEALIVLCGVALGRLPAVLASLLRVLRRRSREAS